MDEENSSRRAIVINLPVGFRAMPFEGRRENKCYYAANPSLVVHNSD
jgi:hypothetical protein